MLVAIMIILLLIVQVIDYYNHIIIKSEMVENCGGNQQMKIGIDSPKAQIMVDCLEGEAYQSRRHGSISICIDFIMAMS